MAEGRAHSPRLRAGGNARPSRACRRRPQGWRRFLHLKSTDSSSIDRSAIGGGDDLYSQIQQARRKGLRQTLCRLPRAFITAEQVKVTRKLLGWSQDALAAVWASPRPPSAVSSSGVSLHPIQLSERSELHSKPLASSSSPANRALN